MNIYLITNVNFDFSDSGLVKWVVIAENEEQALRIDPDPEYGFGASYNPEWFRDAKFEIIGTAPDGSVPRVVCIDWYQEKGYLE